MTADFFEPGKTYSHHLEDGTTSTEGLFHCVYAGRAPAAFEHHSETLGVAFGWRQGIGPSGEWEPLGAYDTPDFAGWQEVRPLLTPGVPDGCRWCNQPGPHGLMYVEGVGLHPWAQPAERQRLERMQERRSHKAAPSKPQPVVCGERLGDAVCALPDRWHGRHETTEGDYWYAADPCGHDGCQHSDCQEPTLECGATAADGTDCCYIAQHRKSGKPHSFEPSA